VRALRVIEPEAVFGFRKTPAPATRIEDLFDALDWVAPGFEIVQSHLPGWKFAAPDTVADGGLHARLLVGPRRAVREIADHASGLDAQLAGGPGPDLARRFRRPAGSAHAASGVNSPNATRHGENPLKGTRRAR
jgi:hypothetical protein